MKKTIRVLNLILICMMLISSFTVVFAEGSAPANPLDGMKPDLTQGSEILTKSEEIIGMLRLVGYFIAVGMMVMIGLKYIQASADEKAEVKSAFIKYLIGALLIVFATNIMSFVFNSFGAGGS